TICDDGKAWDIKCDMVWKPVFSPDGSKVAAKIDKNGKRTIAVNGKLWNKMCDEVWEPVFSPDGSKILCRSVEDGKYYRRVIPVSEF
ncbi:MAG: WD40 repeat domain-containing protein, partial [Deltaproteobacteria bacterium]